MHKFRFLLVYSYSVFFVLFPSYKWENIYSPRGAGKVRLRTSESVSQFPPHIANAYIAHISLYRIYTRHISRTHISHIYRYSTYISAIYRKHIYRIRIRNGPTKCTRLSCKTANHVTMSDSTCVSIYHHDARYIEALSNVVQVHFSSNYRHCFYVSKSLLYPPCSLLCFRHASHKDILSHESPELKTP